MRHPQGLEPSEGPGDNIRSIGCRCKRGDAFSRAVLIVREAWPYHRFTMRRRLAFLDLTVRVGRAARTRVPEARTRGIDDDAGGHGEVAIPVPIPNTEVKHLCADDTAIAGK